MNPIQYKTNKISKKRVYYEGTDTLLEGYLLCYNYDTTTDRDGDTIAEGSQCNGRYLKVEKPSTNNANFFAGVVAAESANKVGPCEITIIEPTSVIIPVYTDVNCTNGTTYLYAANATYIAQATGAVVIGLANETINRSGTNGLTLCRIKINEPTNATVSDSLLSIEVTSKSDDVTITSNTLYKLNSDETVHSDAIAVLSTRIYSVDTMSKSNDTTITSNTLYKLNSDETVHSDAIAILSGRAYSIDTMSKSDDAVVVSNTLLKFESDEKVLSDAIAVISTRVYSLDTMSKSDDTTITSNTLFKLNSDETVHSDAIAVASNATYKINSDMTQIMSDLKSQASNAKTAASNLATMISDDTAYSDVATLASDIRNIEVKNISDLAAAVSNICVAFSDRFA